MYTVKFQHFVPLNPFTKDEKDKPVKHNPVTILQEGENIRHRPFLVKSLEEYNQWRKEFLPEAGNSWHHYVNNDPATQLAESPFDCYFELLELEKDEKFHYFIVFCADCFIMNEAGQTIDSFNC